jgi:hypothetical protein
VIAETAEAAFASVLGADLAAGDALAVHTPRGEVAYWLVPGIREGRPAALARVLADGRLATVGHASGDPAEVATGLSAKSAQAYGPDPVLVVDGPVGREAWLVGERDGRLLLATGGGIYERIADN